MRALAFLVVLSLSAPALAQQSALTIAVVTQEKQPSQPVSRLDETVTEEGLAGARLGLADTMTTSRFTGQRFTLVERTIPKGTGPDETVRALAQEGIRFVVTITDAPTLDALAHSPDAKEMVILNAGTPDDRLRNEDCGRNLLHTLPSRAMVADGLAQYLALKRWKRWFLVPGRTASDKLMADAFRRAAKKFGAEIAVEKEWTFQPGNARTDTGHVALQTEIPTFSQVPDYDVLVVADEANEFGDYIEGRTARPRPIAGTHGIVATAWSALSEQWGATQLQNRFEKQAKRRMTAIDYAAWTAMRSIGEAALRTGSTDPKTVADYMRGPDFMLSGFKGQGQSFRAWDGQMRQPILIAGSRLLVSVSPQPGFLHRTSELDTLGTDREESRCKS